MEVSVETAYAVACQLLGDKAVRERILEMELTARVNKEKTNENAVNDEQGVEVPKDLSDLEASLETAAHTNGNGHGGADDPSHEQR